MKTTMSRINYIQGLYRLHEKLESSQNFTLDKLKSLKKEIGANFTVGKKKKGEFVSDLRAHIMRLVVDGVASFKYNGQAYKTIFSTKSSDVRNLMLPTNFDLCDRIKLNSSSRYLYHYEGPKQYAWDVMFRTNRNSTIFKFLKTDRRLYIVVKSQTSGETLGFAECRFPRDWSSIAYLSIACARSGLGRIIIQTAERIALGYGCSLVLLTGSSHESRRVWMQHGYRSMVSAPYNSLAHRTSIRLSDKPRPDIQSLMYKDLLENPPRNGELILPPISDQWTLQ
jgi:hypothetical protein